MTETAVLESTPHTSLAATTAACATLQPIDAPITTHAMTPNGIVAQNPTLATSPTDITHATPLTGAGLAPATPTAQHRNLSPESKAMPKTFKPQNPHCSKTITIL